MEFEKTEEGARHALGFNTYPNQAPHPPFSSVGRFIFHNLTHDLTHDLTAVIEMDHMLTKNFRQFMIHVVHTPNYWTLILY